MKKFCFTTDLVNNEKLIEEYKYHHRNLWPGLAEHTLKSGIHSLELYNTGDRLVMIIEADDEYDPEKEPEISAELKEKNQEWQKLMSKFQKPLPQANGDVWAQMKKIFDLKDFI